MSFRAERPRAGSPAAASALLLAALAIAAPTAGAATNVWLAPVTVGDAPMGVQAGLVTRVGLTANGKGTVAWNVASDASIASRDFTVGGALEPAVTATAGSLVSSVARDSAGNAIIAGQTAGSPASSWVVTRGKVGTPYVFRSVASGSTVGVPAAFGLKSGFLVASTNSFIPTTTAEGVPTASAFGFTPTGASIPLGKELSQVETGDFSHGGDGSNWALTSDGQAISTGRRETAKPSGGKAPKSVAALIKVGKDQTRNSILGATRFGGGSVSTAGQSIAVAGLDVQQTNEIAVRGIPVVALGTTADGLGETTEIDGVPARRALEVDVAARAGGDGAVVTWLQQTSSKAESLEGQPKWAVVDADGEVTARGSFTSATDVRDLRVVRAGTSEVAVWIRGSGASTAFGAAKITGDNVRLIKAPAGKPLGRLEGNLNTSQLTANGRQIALSFVDQATHTVKVATQTLK